MADKEATVYVIDVGVSMGAKRNGRDESDLDWALRYVWDKLATTISFGRKTLCAGVVAFRSDTSKIGQSFDEDDPAYQNITVLQEIGPVTMSELRSVQEKVKPSSTKHGDAVSAIAVAVQMIAEFCKRLKYRRHIIVVTDGKGFVDLDDFAHIAGKIKEEGIKLTVMGVDFDDAEFGFKEEDKDDLKRQNERALEELVTASAGESVFGTVAEAIAELSTPRVKTTKPVPSYRGKLFLGDPEKEQRLEIDVERFPKTSIAMKPAARNIVVSSNLAPETSGAGGGGVDGDGDVEMNDDGVAAVRTSRNYQVDDPSAPGGKRDVDRDGLSKGYEYGRTVVPIGESEEDVTKLETMPGLEIVGFIPVENYERFMGMSKANMIIAQRTNPLAVLALSSLVWALHEQASCAVARLVARENKEPLLLLLAPSIDADADALVDVELPFAEDVRRYKFPPLDHITTLAGKTLTAHRNLPAPPLQAAMDAFVDALDLAPSAPRTAADAADDGDDAPAELLPLDDTYSPMLHRLQQVIRHRAIHGPSAPLPAPNPTLTRQMHPPPSLLSSARPQLAALAAAAGVQKVPPRSLARRRRPGASATPDAPRSGLDVAALLAGRPTRGALDAANAVPEFRQRMAVAADEAALRDAAAQLGAVLEGWVRGSVGGAAYARAVEGLRVLRDEAVGVEEPGLFNGFARALRRKVLGGELGGDRREFWWAVRAARIALIGKGVGGASDVTEEEARGFLSMVK